MLLQTPLKKEPLSMPQRSIRFSVFVRRLSLCLAAAALATAAGLLPGTAAHAQDLFLTQGETTINNFRSGGVYVGMDSNLSRTDPVTNQPYVATANLVSGASISSAFIYNSSTINQSGGNVSNQISAYDTSTLNLSNGSIGFLNGYDSSTFNISGGSVFGLNTYDSNTANISAGRVNAATSYGSSTINITGGDVQGIGNYGGSTVNISGGNSNDAFIYETGTINISGGSFRDGIVIWGPGGNANFIGTGLSFAYNGYNNTANLYGFYTDNFTITGTVGGLLTSYNLFLRNPEGASGTPNSTARSFTFNGVAPVAAAVPEVGTFALALPALGMVGAVAIWRRKK